MIRVFGEAPNYNLVSETPFQPEASGITVHPAEIPGISDEELIELAPDDVPSHITWDNLADYGYGVATEDLSLAQLRKRFNYWLESQLKNSDERMEEPGKFVEAIWAHERKIPNVAEYADFLYGQGLLNADEVQRAGLVMEVEAVPASERHDRIDSMDEDERYYFDLVYAKLHYLINFHPGIEISNEELKKLAEKYASKCLRAKEDQKYADAARAMLMEARGLSPKEVDAALKYGFDSGSPLRYRGLGINPKLAEQLATTRGGSIFHNFQDIKDMMIRALSGDLSTQLAVRKFFGIENFHELLTYQDRLDRRYQYQKEGAFRFAGSGLYRGVVEIIPVDEGDNEERNIVAKDSMLHDPIFNEEEGNRFDALASSAVQEPALRDYLIHYAQWELMERYVDWIEQEAPLH